MTVIISVVSESILTVEAFVFRLIITTTYTVLMSVCAAMWHENVSEVRIMSGTTMGLFSRK